MANDVVATGKKVFILAHEAARENCITFARKAPLGWMAVFSVPPKRRIQEEKYHAMIGDIARQTTYAGQRWDAEDMKRILFDEFVDACRESEIELEFLSRVTNKNRIIASENGRRIIQLGYQTRDLNIRDAGKFIEFLYAYGTLRDVIWSEPPSREQS